MWFSVFASDLASYRAYNMDLQDLDVDADDYGTAAAEDTPARSRRTEQTEADFEKQRASYTARIENGEVRIYSLRRMYIIISLQHALLLSRSLASLVLYLVHVSDHTALLPHPYYQPCVHSPSSRDI